MTRTLLLGLVCSLVWTLASGCGRENVIDAPPRQPYVYTVGPGDVLEIEIWKARDSGGKEEDLKRPVTVTPDGRISFPLVGSLDVGGKTVQQVAELVRARVKTTLADPFVEVTLVESKSARIHVMGEVGKQGPIPFREGMSVAEAVSEAGILWPTAKTEDIVVLRGALERPTVIEYDLEDVIDGKAKDVYLRPGDIVVLPPKHVTVAARYLGQLLAPLGAITGAAGAAIP